MGKFEKGQYVRVLDNIGAPQSYVKGEVGIVDELYHQDMVRLAGKSAGMFEHRFEPWAPKVGERVKVVKAVLSHKATCVGREFTVVKEAYKVDDGVQTWSGDNAGGYVWRTDELEPLPVASPVAPVSAPATLTIEAGKFYKTRDGRKVGPIVKAQWGYGPDWLWSVDHPFAASCGKAWRADGTFSTVADRPDPADLIAEWVDEATVFAIDTGKTYSTEDGRKIGPVEKWQGEKDCFRSVGAGRGGLWRKNGTAYFAGSKDSPVLVAEWVDEPKAGNDNGGVASLIGKSVTVQIAKPTFKVGDRVLSTEEGPTRGLRGTIIKDDGSDVPYRVRFDDWSYGHGQANSEWWLKSDEITTPTTPTNPAIVCLIENGQPKPSATPHIHADEVKAGKEAARLAGVYKGKEFGVFVLTSSTSQPAPVYKHEWQRQAAAGNKISAIKELRAANDLTLKGAKDAVEHWLATAA